LPALASPVAAEAANHTVPTINSPANSRIPTDEELSRLADLACLPQEARKEFSDFICNTLLPDLQFVAEDRKLIRHHMKRLGQVSGPGRPKGRVNDLILGQLVRDLLHITERAGGRLTFTKESGTGTLIDAIALLAPYMPSGVVIRSPAHSTLQRIKTAHGKKNKQDRARLKDQLSRIVTSETAIEANLARFMGPVKSLREIRAKSRAKPIK
jgi:hypothetical protein